MVLLGNHQGRWGKSTKKIEQRLSLQKEGNMTTENTLAVFDGTLFLY